MEKSADEKFIFFAAADCTGQGIPGAMVSVVCNNALNRSLLEFNLTDTGKILDKTRQLVIETFGKSDKEVKDGMDISLCPLNTVTLELQWSGANNPLWYIRNKELHEIKADKQPIGNYLHKHHLQYIIFDSKKVTPFIFLLMVMRISLEDQKEKNSNTTNCRMSSWFYKEKA